MILNTGLAGPMDLTFGVNSIAVFDYMCVGTGTTAVGATDTSLATEITDSGLERVQVTPTLETTTTTDDTGQVANTFSVTASKTVGEIGVCNASSSGTFLIRSVLSPTKSLSNGDSYTLTIKYVQARA